MLKIRWVVALAIAAASCRSTVGDDVRALAERGRKTGTRLSDYYESLATDTVDSWELTAFRRGFLKLPDPQASTRAAFEAQYKALRARARMARRLANVYESLGRLSSYDTGSEIIGAVTDLESELRNVADSPLKGKLERRAFDSLVNAIATWKQNRELRASTKLLEPIAAGVEELFRSERELYRDIAADRAENYRQVALDLVRAKEVVSSTLVSRVLSSYDLAWPDNKQPFTDERAISGVVEVIEARSKTFTAKSQDELEGVSDALKALVEAHRQ